MRGLSLRAPPSCCIRWAIVRDNKMGEKMNDMKKYIGKRVRLFVSGLADKPIIYTAEVVSVDDNFVTFIDKIGDHISVNIKAITQIREDAND